MDQEFATPQDALAHYGKKGMRWGIRNEEKPTGRDSSAKPDISEKRQAKVEALRAKQDRLRDVGKELDELGIESPEMRRLYGNAVDQSDRMFAVMFMASKDKAVQQQIQANEAVQKNIEKRIEELESGKLTTSQKRMIVGGLAAAAIVGSIGYMHYKDAQYEKAGPGELVNKRVFFKRYSGSSTHLGNKIPGFDSLDDHDVHIPKGTVFSRLTAYKDEDMDQRLYTTFTEADNNRYQGIYAATLKMRTGARQIYTSRMTMGQDVRSPSHRKRVEMYKQMLDERSGPNASEAHLKHNEEKALAGYGMFARGLVVKNEVSDHYFDIVRRHGYNALVDDNDSGQLADMPMILLNAKSLVSKRTFEPVTAATQKAARKNLLELGTRLEKGLSVPEQYRDKSSTPRPKVTVDTKGKPPGMDTAVWRQLQGG